MYCYQLGEGVIDQSEAEVLSMCCKPIDQSDNYRLIYQIEMLLLYTQNTVNQSAGDFLYD